MTLWSSIRRMWAAHDAHLAEKEVEGEATGRALADFGEKAAIMNRVEQVDVDPPGDTGSE